MYDRGVDLRTSSNYNSKLRGNSVINSTDNVPRLVVCKRSNNIFDLISRYWVIVFFIASSLVPSVSFGAYYDYVCSDFAGDLGGGASCDAGVLTMPSGGSYAQDNHSGNPSFNIASPTTWYLTFDYSGSGTGRAICVSSGADFCNSAPNDPYFTASLVNYEMYTGAESGNVGIYFRNDSGSSYTISNICIDDDGETCSPPEEPPPSEGGGGGSLFGTTTPQYFVIGTLFTGTIMFIGVLFVLLIIFYLFALMAFPPIGRMVRNIIKIFH